MTQGSTVAQALFLEGRWGFAWEQESMRERENKVQDIGSVCLQQGQSE